MVEPTQQTNLIRKFWPGFVEENDVSEITLLAGIILGVQDEESIKTAGKFKTNGCNTIERFSQQTKDVLGKWGIPEDVADEMKKLITADAPNFDNYETYSYFCIAVLPNIFEKLR